MKLSKPVFQMYHKMRVIVGNREDRYTLQDMVDYKEAGVAKGMQKLAVVTSTASPQLIKKWGDEIEKSISRNP